MSQLPFSSTTTLTAIRMPDPDFRPLNKNPGVLRKYEELTVGVGLSRKSGRETLDTEMYTIDVRVELHLGKAA